MRRSINYSGFSSKPEDLENFVSELINEANSTNGTWSLATITKVQSSVQRFSNNDARYIFEKLMAELTDEGNNREPVTKYKIAQMFALLKSKQMCSLSDLVAEHKTEIMQVVAKTKSGPLGSAISQLLSSLYMATPPKPTSASPPPQFVYQPRVMQPSKRPVCSHTPCL